jgi:hypothetical protein
METMIRTSLTLTTKLQTDMLYIPVQVISIFYCMHELDMIVYSLPATYELVIHQFPPTCHGKSFRLCTPCPLGLNLLAAEERGTC